MLDNNGVSTVDRTGLLETMLSGQGKCKQVEEVRRLLDPNQLQEFKRGPAQSWPHWLRKPLVRASSVLAKTTSVG
jgi:hypothetical protein